jgi:hypothetical protein
MKLFYNDYNEYHPDGKREAMVTLANRLGPNGLGVLDGIGMQSHLATGWPDIGTYRTALTRFIGTGVEIHITELDITIDNAHDEARQAEVYKSVFEALIQAREDGANITSVTIWGTTDDRSWRNTDNRRPLLFNSSLQPKPAYNAIAGLIPEEHWGDGTDPSLTPPVPDEVKPDANGFFFYHSFDEGTSIMGWNRRGDVTVAHTTAEKNSGTGSIFVSGRTQEWNGAIFTLPERAFKAGEEYSFSVMAMSPTAGTISLSLQYNNLSGVESYDNIASMPVTAGQWVQVSNTSYELPAGSNFSIYVEMDVATASFYFDDAMGGVKGAIINPDGTPGGSVSVRHSATVTRTAAPLVTLRGRTLNVNASADTKVRVNVINMAGKTVARFNTQGGANLSLRRLPAGAYIVETRKIGDGMKTTSNIVLK